MRPVLIILLAPLFADVLRFLHVTKEIAIQTFLAQLVEEALDVGILPGTAWRDKDGFAVLLWQPSPYGVGDELRSIVAAQMFGRTMLLKEPLQQANNVSTGDRASHQHRQTLAAEFVQDRENAQLSASLGTVMDEVVTPDMVAVLCSHQHFALGTDSSFLDLAFG